MTTKTKTANKPVYRLAFASRNGTDLNYPVEVGAVFSRKEADKGLIAKFTIIPERMSEGVLFLFPVKEDAGSSLRGGRSGAMSAASIHFHRGAG